MWNYSDRRTALVGEVKALYCEYPGVPDSMEQLPDFVGLSLAVGPEESDVVYDLRAYLAKRMMDIKK